MLYAFCTDEADTEAPTEEPTVAPTEEPTIAPTEEPTVAPSSAPTAEPTLSPSNDPTIAPTETPTADPTPLPTSVPTEDPTCIPTDEPTAVPSAVPTEEPTADPSPDPTIAPSMPTADPSLNPTDAPTIAPTQAPTGPSPIPTNPPTEMPTIDPTAEPSRKPTFKPTRLPSVSPTRVPTIAPTYAPSRPTSIPTIMPSFSPTLEINALEFDSVFTFNLTTALLSAANQKVLCFATATSIGINTSWVTFTSQGDGDERRLSHTSPHATPHTATLMSAVQELLNTQYYVIVATVTTRFPLDGRYTPDQVYAVLTSNLNAALSAPAFVNYLHAYAVTFNAGDAFLVVTNDDVSVVNQPLVLYGDPTAGPTPGPTKVKPDRMENPELIGTLMGVFFGVILLSTLMYNAILYVRAHKHEESLLPQQKVVKQSVVREQVYLPVEIEEDAPRNLDAVGKHNLRRDMALAAHNKPKSGIVQIVFENQQL